jgi:hypothetical protein
MGFFAIGCTLSAEMTADSEGKGGALGADLIAAAPVRPVGPELRQEAWAQARPAEAAALVHGRGDEYFLPIGRFPDFPASIAAAVAARASIRRRVDSFVV